MTSQDRASPHFAAETCSSRRRRYRSDSEAIKRHWSPSVVSIRDLPSLSPGMASRHLHKFRDKNGLTLAGTNDFSSSFMTLKTPSPRVRGAKRTPRVTTGVFSIYEHLPSSPKKTPRPPLSKSRHSQPTPPTKPRTHRAHRSPRSRTVKTIPTRPVPHSPYRGSPMTTKPRIPKPGSPRDMMHLAKTALRGPGLLGVLARTDTGSVVPQISEPWLMTALYAVFAAGHAPRSEARSQMEAGGLVPLRARWGEVVPTYTLSPRIKGHLASPLGEVVCVYVWYPARTDGHVPAVSGLSLPPRSMAEGRRMGRSGTFRISPMPGMAKL
eukprot:gnl/Dysnectes_brevis/6592_a10351_283.p1 GENE.gnl/Dysnectes_brevis/6592_a10351_283~~gnl/Dysnectes_brevis/6592_a10351_283.p1  ORF type:complete len:324 (+),score=63.55 gnl/Dysnectes_brevis/6592_a10351_283:85-1056(+)